jgi:Enoyl-(Acyl carrier protein) reductase
MNGVAIIERVPVLTDVPSASAWKKHRTTEVYGSQCPPHRNRLTYGVNALSPGATDTEGLRELLGGSEVGQQRKQAINSSVPLGRFGTPEEMAKAALFLASDDSSYITGIELFVDGGMAQV